MGCGNAAMPAGTTKCVFYHRQDDEWFSKGHSLFLTWTGDSTLIVATLWACGLEVRHDGSDSLKIEIIGVTRVASGFPE